MSHLNIILWQSHTKSETLNAFFYLFADVTDRDKIAMVFKERETPKEAESFFNLPR